MRAVRPTRHKPPSQCRLGCCGNMSPNSGRPNQCRFGDHRRGHTHPNLAVGGMLQLQVPQKNSVKPNHPPCAAGMHIVYSVYLPGDDPGKFVGGKHGGTGQAIALRRAGATHY